MELYKNQPVTTAQIQEYFSEQTLNKLHSALSDIHIPVSDSFTECNELLQDLAVNYCKEGLYTRFLQPVLEQAETYSDTTAPSAKAIERLYEKIADYDTIFRNFLTNELFSDLIIPGNNAKVLEHMVMKLQWIIIEYTAIRQSLFLWCIGNSETALTYETVRDYIVLISRLTSYDDDDIRTYLENSFAELIWDWGYAALIVG